MKKQQLRCVSCGRKATLILHGTSYCREHGFAGLNKPAIQITDKSPLEVEARRAMTATEMQTMLASPLPGWNYTLNTSFAAKRVDPRRVARNKRRRALRKARRKDKVQASSS